MKSLKYRHSPPTCPYVIHLQVSNYKVYVFVTCYLLIVSHKFFVVTYSFFYYFLFTFYPQM